MKLKLETCGLKPLFSAKIGKPMCSSCLNSEKHLTFTNIPFALALSVKKIVYQLLKFYTFLKFKFSKNFCFHASSFI